MSILALLAATALAALPEPRPGVTYDPAIPTLQQVVGHAPGEQISSPEQIAAYLRALAGAAPDRTRLLTIGRTWEGRPLQVLMVGAPERMARLDTLQADLARLADPRGRAAAEDEHVIAELPVVVALMHSVHGNEISSSDAALVTAYELLAARGDEQLERVRRETLALIDPLQNPDGRARFLAQFDLARGPQPDPEPAAAEHDEPWPGGRSNHYLFDMNRDWFALTQPETRARVALLRRWPPQVAVDLHEMNADASYYFAPPAEPLNPHIAPGQRAWLDAFGRAIAGQFDARGIAYFNRDVYDSFYPGYGESWPLFQGAIGMTFEQASPRGLLWRRRSDGSLLAYADAVRHHVVASLATLARAAEGRADLLREFAGYRRAAVGAGESGPLREYLLPPGSDPARAERLARLLVAQGIEVWRADEPLRAGSRSLPAGTFMVPLAQPAGRLARNLLDARTPLDDDFVRRQDQRRRQRRPDEIYDVTGWSLPLAFDVECVDSSQAGSGRRSPVTEEPVAAAVAALPPARVAYLMPWGVGAAAATLEALGSGLKVRSAERPFTLAGRHFPAGTAVLRVAENPPDLGPRLAELAARHGAQVTPADSGFVDDGLSLGSARVRALAAPRVLLVWDAPTSSLSAGAARFVLERRYGQRLTVVRASALRKVDLRHFDVLVLPAGDYEGTLGGDRVRRLKEWVEQGGTLVALGEAARFLTRDKVGLLDTHTELRDGRPEPQDEDPEAPKVKDAAKKAEPPPQPFDLERALQPEDERPDATAGALLRVTLDPEHWLSAGTDGEVQVFVEGQRVFTPLKLDKGDNVGLYAAQDTVASGLVWAETLAALRHKAWLMHQERGEGHVIAFAEDPNFRGFAEATELLFINAVLLGPAY